MQNLSYENEFCTQFLFHANKSHFHKNGFALRLALKQRHKGTRKWPINTIASIWRENMLGFLSLDIMCLKAQFSKKRSSSFSDLLCPRSNIRAHFRAKWRLFSIQTVRDWAPFNLTRSISVALILPIPFGNVTGEGCRNESGLPLVSRSHDCVLQRRHVTSACRFQYCLHCMLVHCPYYFDMHRHFGLEVF